MAPLRRPVSRLRDPPLQGGGGGVRRGGEDWLQEGYRPPAATLKTLRTQSAGLIFRPEVTRWLYQRSSLRASSAARGSDDRGRNHSMIERTSYYDRNNSVITQFSKHLGILTTLRHFRSIFKVITPLFRQKCTSYYASDFPLGRSGSVKNKREVRWGAARVSCTSYIYRHTRSRPVSIAVRLGRNVGDSNSTWAQSGVGFVADTPRFPSRPVAVSFVLHSSALGFVEVPH